MSFNTQKSELSLLALANVEALANGENEGTTGYATSTKTITKFKYDDNGNLIEKTEHTEKCCTKGNATSCMYDPC